MNEDAGELALRRQVCFALYAASRATTALYRPMLDELGLTYPQYLVLLVLWERDGRTVKELGEELRLDSGTLSPLLKRLEAAGLVDRHRSAEDERVVEVTLTRDGRALRERARHIPLALMRATGLGREQLVELRDTLTALATTLDRAAEAAPLDRATEAAPLDRATEAVTEGRAAEAVTEGRAAEAAIGRRR